MIDEDGFRLNVGIILSNGEGRLLWARRIGRSGWQFPQGGIHTDETPAQALYRELGEEIGLLPEDVEAIGCTQGWLRYRLPRQFVREDRRPQCIGQKQVWFLLRFLGDDSRVRLDAGAQPEFDRWCWIDYWEPVRRVIYFKRQVYRRALTELAPLLPQADSPASY